MQENKDVRWKQRFENFEKAFFRLKEAIELKEPSELERNGIVQRFEFTIEVAWKNLETNYHMITAVKNFYN